jgi:DNA polymerase-3 subunit gamma/tau
MPPPGELAQRLLQSGAAPARAAASTAPPVTSALAPLARAVGEAEQPVAVPSQRPVAKPLPESFLEVVALADAEGDLILRTNLSRHVHLVHFELGRIEFRPGPQAPSNLANKLGQRLGEWTGRRWIVSISSEPGEASLEQQAEAAADAVKAEALRHPLVQAAMTLFPGSAIETVRQLDITPAADSTDPEQTPDQAEEER